MKLKTITNWANQNPKIQLLDLSIQKVAVLVLVRNWTCGILIKLGFPEASLFFSENLTPYNQKLTWKCREQKRAGKIHSSWSSKGVIKLRCTMNERASSIENEIELSNLYPDFVFQVRQKQGAK